jgi:hypothetical protein
MRDRQHDNKKDDNGMLGSALKISCKKIARGWKRGEMVGAKSFCKAPQHAQLLAISAIF